MFLLESIFIDFNKQGAYWVDGQSMKIAVTGENLKIHKEFNRRVAELKQELANTRLMGEQVEKIGEGVKKWQQEKGELEAKIAGIVNFQKLVLEQPDEVILDFIKDVRRQLKEQDRGNNVVAEVCVLSH